LRKFHTLHAQRRTEAAWHFVTPVLEYWEKNQVSPPYPAVWGPIAADKLLRNQAAWREPTVE
jgi:glucose-6-phosphate 1-dehydrogenase